ncbi:MAG: threonine/serine dehydratase [Woeseiaceae bacterium]
MSCTIQRVAESAECAAARIAGLVRETPLDYSPMFSELAGGDVWFKLENLQHTGSFKLRGAANRLMTLGADQRAKGCVAASSGNHGAAIAYAMQKLNIDGVVFVPERTSPTKVSAIKSYGGDVRFHGTDGLDTELHAREFAAERGMCYVSPYNDEEVMAGQGSCGVEIVTQIPDLDDVYIAIGGGGLISGVGSVLKRHDPDIRIVGCQPAASQVMTRSVEAGEILALPSEPTLSDGTAGGIEQGAITFDICRQVTDEFIVVSEDEIAAAMRRYVDYQHQLIEGAAGVAIAAMLRKKSEPAGRKIVVLICGANISREMLQEVL